eukprot:CAMPEP_0181430010 /NCGR_PEP_ID=MMETSP1110-20121109/17500_1 /TAXON_ID=174948 /ORGANISM="Symbiodinium sp., Strain CCMP421" /LENGTH=32 /DNA_ID= /DNA_START= /DNA_END= /DNA_ORIENTATION=
MWLPRMLAGDEAVAPQAAKSIKMTVAISTNFM